MTDIAASHETETWWPRLAAWLARALEARHGTAVTGVQLEQLSAPASGMSNDTLLFAAQWEQGGAFRSGEFVLRRQPESNRLFFDADVTREHDVLAHLATHSTAPVPTLLGCEPSTDILGTPFFVMSRVPGIVPFGKPSIHVAGWLPTLSPDQRRQVWQSGMDVLARVAGTDWRPLAPRLGFGPAGPRRGVLAHLEWLDRYHAWATKGRSYPITAEALRYLRTGVDEVEAVDAGLAVLCWGDARLGNMIFSPNLTVAAAIDWELATIGPPEIDLGHWTFFDEFYSGACGVTPLEGFPNRAETVAAYEQRTRHHVHHLEYFEVMAATMLATTVIRQAERQVELGWLPDTNRMGHGNTVTQVLARRLGLPVPELDTNFLALRNMHPTGS